MKKLFRGKQAPISEDRVIELCDQANRIWEERRPPVSREAVLLAMLIALYESDVIVEEEEAP
jgi:hypothetical protein